MRRSRQPDRLKCFSFREVEAVDKVKAIFLLTDFIFFFLIHVGAICGVPDLFLIRGRTVST
jgi:hypothetical protein